MKRLTAEWVMKAEGDFDARATNCPGTVRAGCQRSYWFARLSLRGVP
jgi:hypothetical protein